VDLSLWKWIFFNAGVLALLVLDLGVFHRRTHVVKVKEALWWSAFWIALSLAFNALIWRWRGPGVAVDFFTGYLIEKSLSVDNIFVFVLIFSYFKVPAEYQHRVLFWGILGALLMRGALIAVGSVLISSFVWVIYVFGLFLIFTGVRMAMQKTHGVDPERNPLVRGFRQLIPVTASYRGKHFFVREGSRLAATPLMLVLVVVEVTDLIFAVDSIPAIFAVTDDPFIVYTSNVFAILGLRSLYFALAGVAHRFRYLKPGLAVVLVFVGIKMLLSHTAYQIPTFVALSVIGVILVGAVGLSLAGSRDKTPESDSE
jgi:tellurite resistance protein TerC